MIKKIALFGGGGFGREIAYYLTSEIEAGIRTDVEIAGVVDANPKCEATHCSLKLKYLGDLETVQNPLDYFFLIAVGTVKGRQSIAMKLEQKGLSAFTYVHGSVILAADASIGTGSIICPFSIINSGATVGNCCAINVFSSVGHGASVGNYSVLSPYSVLNGDSRIGDGCFLGTRATISPAIKIGEACIVDSHTHVKNSQGDRKMISDRQRQLVVDNRLGDHAR